jgi:hypothetical protein
MHFEFRHSDFELPRSDGVGAGDGNRIHRPMSILRVSACFRNREMQKNADPGFSFVTFCHATTAAANRLSNSTLHQDKHRTVTVEQNVPRRNAFDP